MFYANDQNKPRLHSSMLEMAFRCGVQFEERYINGRKIPPNFALNVGSATHKVADHILTKKVLSGGEIISLEETEDTAVDAFNYMVEKEGMRLDPEEASLGIKDIKGHGIDLTVSLSKLYHDQLAPIINPKSEDEIESPWLVVYEGFDFDLAGTMDVAGDEIRDLKTWAKSPNQDQVDRADQYTMYALGFKINNGFFPKITQDTLVKTKTPKVVSIETVRTQEHINVLMARMDQFLRAYKAGIFLPTNQTNWWCNPKHCGYALTCPYYSGVKTFQVQENITNGTNGK